MKLLFSDKDNETSSGYVIDQDGGNPLLKEMAVPAGLFFIQNAYKKEHNNFKSSDDSFMPESLYNKLFSLLDDETSTKTKTKKRKSKPVNKSNRKTKKNN